MKVSKEFLNIKCDCCGELLDPDMWYEEDDPIGQIYDEEGWKCLGGKDYCMDCWQWNDDDCIVTKDGKVFDEDGRLLKEGLSPDDELMIEVFGNNNSGVYQDFFGKSIEDTVDEIMNEIHNL